MPRYDATTAECLVYTFREGLLSAVGHDLCLRVSRFTVHVEDDAATSATSIWAEFDATSLRATGDVSPADARKIERNAADDVLDARRYPSIAFRSTEVTREGTGARIVGTLTLHGVARPLAIDAVLDDDRWNAEVRLDQRDFAIRPYVALFGALRVRADVLVRIAVPRQ
jgi:polyisoprenoid-binding protein YceI